MILSKKLRWTKALALTLVLVALSCSSDDNGTPDTENNDPVAIGGTVSVADDISDTTTIFEVDATDIDDDPLAYEVTTDADDLFEVDAEGKVSLIQGKALDASQKQQHQITVTVSDDRQGSDTANITINVTAGGSGQAGAPVFQDPPVGAIEVAEDITDQDVIVALKAEDPEGDEFTFSILEDDDALFEINQDGELSLLAGKQLNAEESDSHSVTVAVKDSNGNQATLQLTLTVLETENKDAFITTWTVTEDDKTIRIGTFSILDYDYIIDWGDETVENITLSESPEHTYPNAGTYTVAITGQFPAMFMENVVEESKHLSSIEQWGNVEWESFTRSFFFCENMVYNATDAPDLSKVSSTQEMFIDCHKFNGDLSEWDVSNVTNMLEMFKNAFVFNGNVDNWNVGNVENMSGMFTNASEFNRDISGWNVSTVNNMNQMFKNTTEFNQDISIWDDKLGNVITMFEMFAGCDKFNQDISGWDVSNVKDVDGMFRDTGAFNQNLGPWGDKLGNVDSFEGMFEGSVFNQDIGDWDVSHVKDMNRMFKDATEFNQDLSSWNVGNVENMGEMFKNATAFDQNLGSWNLISMKPSAGPSFDSMESMLDNSGLSPENFANSLIGWAGNVNSPDNLRLGAADLTFCNQAINAFSTLTQTKMWDINEDDGPVDCQ